MYVSYGFQCVESKYEVALARQPSRVNCKTPLEIAKTAHCITLDVTEQKYRAHFFRLDCNY